MPNLVDVFICSQCKKELTLGNPVVVYDGIVFCSNACMVDYVKNHAKTGVIKLGVDIDG